MYTKELQILGIITQLFRNSVSIKINTFNLTYIYLPVSIYLKDINYNWHFFNCESHPVLASFCAKHLRKYFLRINPLSTRKKNMKFKYLPLKANIVEV